MSFKRQLLVTSTLTLAEMKARYRNTLAGVLWVMLNPLIMFAVQALIFKYILRIDIERYFIFLLSGLLPWIFIYNTISQSVHAFITMRESLLSFQIHPMSIILSKTLDQFINFILPFILLFFYLRQTEDYNIYGILFLPIALLILLVGTFAFTLFLANLQVFLRDTQYISNFMLSILFFLTPIFYPRHMLPAEYQVFVDLNPFYNLIYPFKVCLWQFNSSDLYTALVNGAAVTSICVALALVFWRWTRNEFYINI